MTRLFSGYFHQYGSHMLHTSVEAKGYLEMAGGNLQQACCCKGFLSASACGDPCAYWCRVGSFALKALGLFFEMGGGSSSPEVPACFS